MITKVELQMLRNADPGAVLPGIDTPTGNPLKTSSLLSYTKITQSGVYYNAAQNYVIVKQAGTVLSGINFGSANLIIAADNVTIRDCSFTGTQYGAKGGTRFFSGIRIAGQSLKTARSPGCRRPPARDPVSLLRQTQ